MPDWRAWLDGQLAGNPDAQPDASFLPALMRRRLDRFGRMALYTAWTCAEGLDSIRLVFASRHGALDRTVSLLSSLANQEGVSPALFSLSVHNSTAGLFSIARGDRSAITALAAGADTLCMSLLEGANLLAEGAGRVLVCYADDAVPAPYRPFVAAASARLPFAISLLLVPAAEASVRCRLARHAGAATQVPEEALLRFLVENAAASILGVDQPWRLERGPDAG
ncbi:MAG: beta-ketoacyl synthase chain length factor [Gammaproteobacteria bacterium]